MFTLSTNIELPIAHRLTSAYSGLCVGNLDREGNRLNDDNFGVIHGHNYFITFEISTNEMNKDFMVMDFKKVKKIIHQEMDKYDHSMILKKGDPLIDFYKKEYNKRNIDFNITRVYEWKEAPTAEYMSYKWYNELYKVFSEEGIRISKLAVTVEETSHNKVTYTE